MTRFTLLAASLTLCLFEASVALAQHGVRGGTPMTFFVTSRPIGDGGNLGGLQGADAHCGMLAGEVGAGDRTWRAYLSTQERPGQPAVNARDRIGAGPWYNYDGVMIARDVAHLHGDTIEQARLGNNLHKLSGLTGKGPDRAGTERLPASPRRRLGIRQDDPLQQSPRSPDGLAARRDLPTRRNSDYTCNNWTSNEDPDFETEGRRHGRDCRQTQCSDRVSRPQRRRQRLLEFIPTARAAAARLRW